MAEFMTAVCGEDDVASGRRGDQGAQRLEPADDAAAALGGRLPPRAVRRHDDERPPVVLCTSQRDDDVESMRWGAAARADEAGGAALRDCLEHGRTVDTGHMHGRGAVGVAKPLGVEEAEAGPVTGAQHDERTVAGVAADTLEFAGIDCARRQFGDADIGVAAEDAETPFNSGVRGRRRIEHRHRRDLPHAEFEKAADRVEPVEREFLDRHLDAECGRLPRQPGGAGSAADRRGAVDAELIPGGEPCRCARLRFAVGSGRIAHRVQGGRLSRLIASLSDCR